MAHRMSLCGLLRRPGSGALQRLRLTSVDPYADSDFKVQRRPHRPGTALSLRRLSCSGRSQSLRGIAQGDSTAPVRSQYDCEAADRAGKYLKAGLDVWGFGAWQMRHFPMDGYKGATLPQCKDVKDIVDILVGGFAVDVAQHHP